MKSGEPFELAYRQLLPSHEQGLLLTACLHTGDAAGRAWSEFGAVAGDPKVYFETNRTGLKGLLPFVGASLAANGVGISKPFQTYVRVAMVREGLRSRIYAEILGTVLDCLGAAQIPVVLLKGGALSAAVYPQPSTRHNHAIDLLVDPRQMLAASAALAQIQFTPGLAGPGAAHHRTFRHSSGLALGLHSRLLFLPHFDLPVDEIRARLRTISIDGRAVWILSPEDSLVHICGHAAYSRGRANLRWACDVHFLLQQNPALDWPLVVRLAAQSGVVLPTMVLLQWMREMLRAPIPGERLAELRTLGAPVDAVTSEGLYAALLHSIYSRRTVLHLLSTSRRAQCEFLGFCAFPSLRFMRWKHDVDGGWNLAAHYLDRPRRLALHLLRGGATTGTRPSIDEDLAAMAVQREQARASHS
ncbi:MAG: nucleotidyltransferase family protein [Pseudomonadota bacterium]